MHILKKGAILIIVWISLFSVTTLAGWMYLPDAGAVQVGTYDNANQSCASSVIVTFSWSYTGASTYTVYAAPWRSGIDDKSSSCILGTLNHTTDTTSLWGHLDGNSTHYWRFNHNRLKKLLELFYLENKNINSIEDIYLNLKNP